MIFSAYEPFGSLRADLHTSIIASSMVNAWGGKTTLADFMPPKPTFQHHKEARKEPLVDDGYVSNEDMLQMIDGLMDRQDRRKALERRQGTKA